MPDNWMSCRDGGSWSVGSRQSWNQVRTDRREASLRLALEFPQGLSLKSGCCIFFVAICLVLSAHASFWPPQIVVSASSNFVASLQTSSRESLVIRSNNAVLCSFAYEDFGIRERSKFDLMSTAGLLWYRDSISFFDKSETCLVMRLNWGRFVIVNLQTRTASLDVPPEMRQEIDETVTLQVLSWLNSSSAGKRELGQRYAKDLKLHTPKQSAPMRQSDSSEHLLNFKLIAESASDTAGLSSLLLFLEDLKRSGHDFSRVTKIQFISSSRVSVDFLWSGGFHAGEFEIVKESLRWRLLHEAYYP